VSRPPTPQFEDRQDTGGGWAWTWKTWEGIEPHQVQHEVELVWHDEQWKVSSRYSHLSDGPRKRKGGWGPAQLVDSLDEPESQQHADELAREYAFRPRGH
jgi:hypothetical protein